MVRIDPLRPEDWSEVGEIYRTGMETGDATFERDLPSWEDWDAGHLPMCRFVAREGEVVVGWAAVSPVSTRAVYRGVVEVSVYVRPSARRRGVGRALLERVIRESEASGLWTLQAGIFPENTPSLELHEACGFRRVGVRERIGKRNGVWRDVVLLERRSPTVG